MAISLSHPLPEGSPTDGYGWRPAIPGVVDAGHHNGQDWAAPAGTPILAAHDGRVSYVGWDVQGGGWMVRVEGDGFSTLYLHNLEQSTLVQQGQRVSAGQPVARVGASGAATGPHLHFILLAGGSDVDPVPHISTPVVGQEEDEDMNYIWIQGKVGARRGGLYAIIGRQAVFLGGKAPAGVPSVTDEARIADLQKHIRGLA